MGSYGGRDCPKHEVPPVPWHKEGEEGEEGRCILTLFDTAAYQEPLDCGERGGLLGLSGANKSSWVDIHSPHQGGGCPFHLFKRKPRGGEVGGLSNLCRPHWP